MTIVEGGVDIVPQTQLATGRGRLRHRLGAQGAGLARAGREDHRHRPDLPAVGHAAGLVEGLGADLGREPGRQEGRQLGLRQRVRAVRRAAEGRRRPEVRGHPRPAAVRHGGVAEQADRRGAGDDLQRVRAGARAEEPGHRGAVPADRPQRHRLEQGRRRHAPGRHLGQHRQAEERHGLPGHRGQAAQGRHRRLGLLPRQLPAVRRHRAQERPDARAPPTRPGSWPG